PWLSSAYMTHARPIWRRLFRHWMPWPFALALLSAGNSMPASTAMIAMTTSSSISVNPRLSAFWFRIVLSWLLGPPAPTCSPQDTTILLALGVSLAGWGAFM